MPSNLRGAPGIGAPSLAQRAVGSEYGTSTLPSGRAGGAGSELARIVWYREQDAARLAVTSRAAASVLNSTSRGLAKRRYNWDRA